MKFLDEIYLHCESKYPEEACGLIGTKDDIQYWIPCSNHSEDPENSFRFNSVEYISAFMKYKIEFIVHSHTNDDPEPSEHDKSACNALKIPYLIVALPSRHTRVVFPDV